jgi:hypothetical protein
VIASGEFVAITAFAVAALTIVILMFFLATIISIARHSLIGPLRSSTQNIKRLGGAILVVVGFWLIILALWADNVATILNN